MPQKCTTNKIQDFPNVFLANLQPSRVNVYILQTSVFISFNSTMLHSNNLCLPTFVTYSNTQVYCGKSQMGMHRHIILCVLRLYKCQTKHLNKIHSSQFLKIYSQFFKIYIVLWSVIWTKIKLLSYSFHTGLLYKISSHSTEFQK